MSITVFLADDHAVLRDGLRILLEAEGDIQVVGEAGDGESTIAEFANFCPDVVVIDIVMPGMNGIETIKQILTICPKTQFVVLSMYATTEYIFQALQAGTKGYLLKRAAGNEVIAAVRAVHAKQRYLSQGITDLMIDDYILHRNATEAEGPLDSLSSREREILPLVAIGKSNTEVAELLHLSPETVKTYRSRMMHKLNITDLPTLVRFAIQHKLISLE